MNPAISPPGEATVVLLHASGSSPRQWGDLVEALGPRYRVRAVELHGHGARPEWTGRSPLRLADDAALVEPLLGRAGGAYLVGHSYGAAVALEVAVARPCRVLGVVAYEPTLFRLLLDDDALGPHARDVVSVAECIRAGLARGDPGAGAERFIDFWSGPGTWRSLAASRQLAVASRMGSVLRHFDALIRAPFERARLARLDCPLLLLAGAGSVPAALRIAQLLRQAIPAARHERLPGMGHMGPITHAREFNRRVAAFLQSAPLLEAAP